MTVIFKYISYMLPFMFMAIPIFLILRFFHLKSKNKIIKFNYLHELALLIFVSFIIGLSSVTILPAFKINGFEIEFITDGNGSINLIPFKVFSDTYKTLFLEKNINYFLINVIGNIIMFLPFGFFPALLWKPATLSKAVFTGFLCSMFVEICQLHIARETDIDDLWLNASGAALGFLLYKILEKFLPDKVKKFKF
ncbi:MAG: hypothetical protein A2Y15_03305 [Clostridiales bacterium GWF2_36_10]|nr:MAG: hypothetical protein A2Y15_03305 [Clostridiales bacterium GWF2_36_10]